MASNINSFKKINNEVRNKSDPGYFLKSDTVDNAGKAHQFGRDIGRLETKKNMRDLIAMNQVLDKPNQYYNTAFGVMQYDDTIEKKVNQVPLDVASVDFQEWIYNQYDAADPVRHKWLKETYPTYFELEKLKLEEQYEAYLHHQMKMIFPNESTEDFVYDFLLEKGMPPPSVDWWKIQAPSKTHPTKRGTKYEEGKDKVFPFLGTNNTYRGLLSDTTSTYKHAKAITKLFFKDYNFNNEGQFKQTETVTKEPMRI